MDETPKQLIKEVRSEVPMKPGFEKRVDYEYSRCGVCNIFMVSEPLAGKRYMKVTQNRTKKDWALLVRYICDKLYPKTENITLIMDNLASHSAAALYETFAPAEAKRLWDRLEFVFTPKHGVNRNKKCSDFGKKNYSGNGNSLCSNFGNNSAVTVVLN